eukprot:COSAG01_NODE_70771_length_257_cov_2.405063_1_plen_24_part_10
MCEKGCLSNKGGRGSLIAKAIVYP